MGRKQDGKKPEEHQSQQQVDQSQEEVDQQDMDNMDQYDDPEEIQDSSILLKKIEDKLLQCDEQQKLSWGAIYSIKQKQGRLNQQMQQQIDAIKQKYQKQRVPLLNEISDAVAGKKLDKSLYSENQLIKNINLNKTKPKAIGDYWGRVFESCGLVGNEDDIELLEKLVSFKCELVDASIENYKLTMEFKENDYFNGILEIEVKGNAAEGSFKKTLNCKKKEKVLDQNSLFGLLTSQNSDDQQLHETCRDLYRAYISSVYFYFYEAQQIDDDGQQDEQEQGSDNEQDQEDVKPIKKTKGSAITQKPQCKNQ